MRRRHNAGYGNNVLILRLQGFIFFFSAEMLRGTVLKFVRSCAEARPFLPHCPALPHCLRPEVGGGGPNANGGS